MAEQSPAKEKAIAEMISVMESARDDGERNCQDLVRIHVGHICATISLLKDLQQVRTCLTGISTCSTCEACRGAATRALGGDAPNAWRPIETAPTGGKWVLLWWPSVTDAPFVGYRVYDKWHAATNGDTWVGPGPTHWMPLPLPPETNEECRSINCNGANSCPDCTAQPPGDGPQ